MADNYLEKRMDDYRSGRLSPSHRNQKLTPGGKPSGMVGFQLEVSRVFVAMECPQLREAISRGFADAGCRVAFCGTDRAAGTKEAQRFGMMFCPVDRLDADTADRMIALVSERWHGVDLVVTDMAGISAGSQAKMLVVASKSRCAEPTDGCSAVIYAAPAGGQFSEKEVQVITQSVLLQGCNAGMRVLTELT